MDTLQILEESLYSTIAGRQDLLNRTSTSYSGKRDIYGQAGYPTYLQYSDFEHEFKRHDIAKRVVTAFPEATWKEKPIVKENEDQQDTDFEKKFKQLVASKKVYHYLYRADILSNIGQYSVVFLGFDDINSSQDLKRPVINANSLKFLQVYSQNNAKIKKYYDDIANENYGKPELYQITTSKVSANRTQTHTIEVHESRIVHISENNLENDYLGTPRLEAVFNRLKDLSKILPAAAEGFWRSAWPGLIAKKDPNTRWTSNSRENISSQFQSYVHGMSRYMKLEGVDIQELEGTPSDPSNHVGIILELIAGTANIPRRILTGSEMGEMASTQDRENWHERVMERRNNWAIPTVLDQFLYKIDNAGVLEVPNDYIVDWRRVQHTERDQTEINRKKANMVSMYAKELEKTSRVYSHYDFLTKIMEHSHSEATSIIERSKKEKMQVIQKEKE